MECKRISRDNGLVGAGFFSPLFYKTPDFQSKYIIVYGLHKVVSFNYSLLSAAALNLPNLKVA